MDGYGREVVLRGFNVSGEVKLAENGFLPFASTADAQSSAQAMRQLTGANAVRFLVSWAGAEPTRGQLRGNLFRYAGFTLGHRGARSLNPRDSGDNCDSPGRSVMFIVQGAQ